MIEQLQKIAEDAGVDARTMGFESNQHHRDPWNARLEKFAELIVRECAEFIAPLGDYCGGHGEPSAPSSRECARRLKQHFGVEE